MRTRLDRLRHAVAFEVIALAILAPLGGSVFGVSMGHFGVVAAVSSAIAMAGNYVYNLGFDHVLLRLGMSLRKTVPVRILHAIGFEAMLLIVLVPFIAWYLGVGLAEALTMDVSLSLFYLVYAFVFNWGYDLVFPIPEGA